MGRSVRSILDCVIHPYKHQKARAATKEQEESALTQNKGASSPPIKINTTTNQENEDWLPSTMTGPPVSAYCAPRSCQLTETPTPIPLLSRTRVSETAAVLRFGLPDTEQPLNLSTCACILAKSEIEGEMVVRPYTPISTNHNVGYFDLLVRNYGAAGKMSRHLHEIKPGVTTSVSFLFDEIKPGDTTSVSFFHVPVNIKIQAPAFLEYEEILMIIGGTGVTPMIQALHEILGSSNDDGVICHPETKKTIPVVTVLYGSRTSQDILGQELLSTWAQLYPDQLKLHFVLSQEPEDSTWTGLRGRINKDLIVQHFPDAQGNEPRRA
eukprot:CAMPEP_0172472628 /NCGR_PEP_ID=MMETSP1065-20121228/68438_1 /TAXON_ID=265537 /ORGANISM="Amphiprora paludosa, Strain CCMP125" /LENGTH=323 /DNA_ID=CAMNT_0013230777 /DNA_START=1007 /DNA_END=1975 /DNA_ORIENTATION=+